MKIKTVRTEFNERRRFLNAICLFGFVVGSMTQLLFGLTPFLATNFDSSLKTISWLLGVFPLLQAVFLPLLGIIADRFKAKTVLLISTVLIGVGQVAMISPSLELIFFARVLQGIAASALIVAFTETAYRFTGTNRLMALSRLTTALLLGSVGGVMIPALLLKTGGWPLLSVCILSILVINVILIIRIPDRSTLQANPFKISLSFPLVLTFISALLIAASYLGFYTFVSLKLVTHPNPLSDAILLSLALIMSIGGLVFFPNQWQKKITEPVGIALTAFGMGSSFLLAINGSTLFLIIAILLGSVFMGLNDVFLSTLESRLSNQTSIGLSLSFGFTFAALGRFFGSAFISSSAQAILFTSLLAFGSAAVILILFKKT